MSLKPEVYFCNTTRMTSKNAYGQLFPKAFFCGAHIKTISADVWLSPVQCALGLAGQERSDMRNGDTAGSVDPGLWARV